MNKVYKITEDFELKELTLLSVRGSQFEVIDNGYCYLASKDYFYKTKLAAQRALGGNIQDELTKNSLEIEKLQKKNDILLDKQWNNVIS